ncbi:sodium/potassium/calcium exchanger 4a isoform 2-T2 [Polymixia lowei]
MESDARRSVVCRRYQRKRRQMVDVQVSLLLGMLGVTWAISALLVGIGHIVALDSKMEISAESHALQHRRLLAVSNDTQEKNCTEPAIHHFPADIFSESQRSRGAVLLHIMAALYMFLALAIVCDDYFVVSLEKICEKLDLSEDVAGATFMAAGSSAPELFASVIGVFITRGDVGVGTIVGSAVFNILCIIGVCGLFAGQVVYLTKYAVFRDSICYTLSVLALIVFIYDGQIEWWESLVLVLMYVGYILVMKFNSSIRRCLVGRQQEKAVTNSNVAYNPLENGSGDYSNDPSKPLLPSVKPSSTYTGSGVLVESMIDRSPPQYGFPEAGLRLMITNHFGPKTRFYMASRLIIHQASIGTAVTMVTEPANNRMLVETREDRGGNSPFTQPGSTMEKLKWLVSWPIFFLLYLTVPDCSQSRWEKYFLVSFFGSTLWIAVFSYIMVWMVTIIGYTLSIPDVIMGITFLAAGTSVPDCIASLLVARQGQGDMAVSNSLGSNVFDILIGLGIPWSIQTLAVRLGSQVQINSRGLFYSVVLLLGSVALTVLGIHVNSWRLDTRLGVCVLLLYAVFLTFSVLIEYNVFTFINLPMCSEE